MTTCIRCAHPITDNQACVPIFRGYQVNRDPSGGPSCWRHSLRCCTECGALGGQGTDPKPHEHARDCQHHVHRPSCRAQIEGLFTDGLQQAVVCTRPAGHKGRIHRAAAKFAGPTIVTVSWPVDGSHNADRP